MPTQNSIDTTNPLGTNVAGTGLSSPTQYGVVYGNGSGALGVTGALANGATIIGSTSGAPVATTLTAGTGCYINNASGSITIGTNAGEMVWLSTSTIPGGASSIAITSGITTQFKNYLFVLNNITFSGAADTFAAQVGSSTGPTWVTTGYQGIFNTTAYNGTTYGGASNISTYIPLSATLGIGVSTVYNGLVWAYNLSTGGDPAIVSQATFTNVTPGLNNGQGGCTCTTATNTAIKFYTTVGNLSTGTIAMYGIYQ